MVELGMDLSSVVVCSACGVLKVYLTSLSLHSYGGKTYTYTCLLPNGIVLCIYRAWHGANPTIDLLLFTCID